MSRVEFDPPIAQDDGLLLLRWEHYGLKSEFPHVDPTSRIAKLMVNLYVNRESGHEELDELPITDNAGFDDVRSVLESTARKIKIVQGLIHYISQFNGDANVNNADGFNWFDLFREVSTSERLKIEVAKGISESQKAEIINTVNFAQLYLFVDDWDLRKGSFPK